MIVVCPRNTFKAGWSDEIEKHGFKFDVHIFLPARRKKKDDAANWLNKRITVGLAVPDHQLRGGSLAWRDPRVGDLGEAGPPISPSTNRSRSRATRTRRPRRCTSSRRGRLTPTNHCQRSADLSASWQAPSDAEAAQSVGAIAHSRRTVHQHQLLRLPRLVLRNGRLAEQKVLRPRSYDANGLVYGHRRLPGEKEGLAQHPARQAHDDPRLRDRC